MASVTIQETARNVSAARSAINSLQSAVVRAKRRIAQKL
jgi:hypothetical protein